MAVLGYAGAIVGGGAIAWGAVQGLIHRETNVDELVAIAIVASLIVGEYWGAGLVAFMMLFGKVLEDVTAARAKHAIEGLGKLVPSVARVKAGECLQQVDQARLLPWVRLTPSGYGAGGVAAGQSA